MKGKTATAAILIAFSMFTLAAISMATTASAGKSVVKRGNDPWFFLPIGPSYIGYDYPYYYSRGHYLTFIRPGYIYYGQPYEIYRSKYRSSHDGRCAHRHRKCVADE
jgi:hypothetical protein